MTLDNTKYRLVGRYREVTFDYSINYTDSNLQSFLYLYSYVHLNYAVAAFLSLNLLTKVEKYFKDDTIHDFNWVLYKNKEEVLTSNPLLHNTIAMPGNFYSVWNSSYAGEGSAFFLYKNSPKNKLILSSDSLVSKCYECHLTYNKKKCSAYIISDETDFYCYLSKKRVNLTLAEKFIDYFFFNIWKGIFKRGVGDIALMYNPAFKSKYIKSLDSNIISAGYKIYFFHSFDEALV